MDYFLILLPFGAVILPLLYQRHFDDWRAARFWVAAWWVLLSAGVCLGLPDSAAALVASQALLALFGAASLAGAVAFAGRSVPWSIAWTSVAALIGVVVFRATLGPTGSGLLAGGYGFSLLVIAGVILLRHGRITRASIPERALGPALLALAALYVVDPILRHRWADASALGLLGPWLAIASVTCVLQLTALLGRARAREDRQLAERELLRNVALVLADQRDPRASLARVASELHYFGRFRMLGIWSLSRDGQTFELLEDRGRSSPFPDELRSPGIGTPLGRATAAAREPFLIPAMENDPRVQLDASGPGLVAPLRVGERLVGCLAVALAFDTPIDGELRQFVTDLADEVALVLANIGHSEERREQARALEAERQTLRALVDGSSLGILLVDSTGRVRLMNRRFGEHAGLERPASWLGEPGAGLLREVRGRVAPASHATLGHLTGDGDAELAEVDVQITAGDGSVLGVSAQPVRYSDGTLVGRVFITRDVTERYRLSLRLQHAERMETLGTLAGGLAHDFNNQLTAILGNAKLLRSDLTEHTSEPLADPEVLFDLERSAEHCAELTRGLLDFARQSPAILSAVDVLGVVEEAASLLRPSLPPEVSLVVDVAPRVTPAWADESQLRRVLTNLLVNARDAVGDCGRIEISARGEGAGAARSVLFEVRDDGIGMDEDTRRRIFDPFFTTKEIGRGTGLGLSVVYGNVEAHGGTIEVDSQPTKGTVFTIEWPAARTRAAAPPPATRRPDRRDRVATVLVAEDQSTVLRLARTALERAGHRVLEARDGEEAVERFRLHQPEITLALFDLSMPRATGVEALRRIRQLAPDLPAVIMSGHPDREDASTWPDRVRLLPKPFGPDQLLEVVGEVLDEASSDPRSPRADKPTGRRPTPPEEDR